MKLSIMTYESPVGVLRLVATEQALTAVLWPHERTPEETEAGPGHSILRHAAGELDAFFAGDRTAFTVPLNPMSGTDFQRRVWAQLRRIPYGETRSYADIARALKQPTATRAVGAANGRNPLPLFVPCHRVIGSDGSLTGFAGGHAAKRQLLALESQRAPAPLWRVSSEAGAA